MLTIDHQLFQAIQQERIDHAAELRRERSQRDAEEKRRTSRDATGSRTTAAGARRGATR
ncbi:hypothetical protein [Myceligenerans crystallogenes]|uniref:Uncharacterized protein n=1 Tax=Myceligenerans crystallogenes TaxID=316335 RepID=A0ABN2NA45_9MICO